MSMKLNSQDLEKITDLTLDYYNRHAEDFWEGTRNHDVSQNIASMLQHIQGERPFTIRTPPQAAGVDVAQRGSAEAPQSQLFRFSRRPMASAASIVKGDFGPSPFFGST